jgi:hypothetical protein
MGVPGRVPGAVVKEKIATVDMTWRRDEFLYACGKVHKRELNIQMNPQQRAGASPLEECSLEMVLQKKMNVFQFPI